MTVIEFLRSGGLVAALQNTWLRKCSGASPGGTLSWRQCAAKERVSAPGSPRQPGGSKSTERADRVALECNS